MKTIIRLIGLPFRVIVMSLGLIIPTLIAIVALLFGTTERQEAVYRFYVRALRWVWDPDLQRDFWSRYKGE